MAWSYEPVATEPTAMSDALLPDQLDPDALVWAAARTTLDTRGTVTLVKEPSHSALIVRIPVATLVDSNFKLLLDIDPATASLVLGIEARCDQYVADHADYLQPRSTGFDTFRSALRHDAILSCKLSSKFVAIDGVTGRMSGSHLFYQNPKYTYVTDAVMCLGCVWRRAAEAGVSWYMMGAIFHY